VLSLRENELGELPEELGTLKELRVLDIIGNRVRCLPVSFSNLQLDAFWIDSSQVMDALEYWYAGFHLKGGGGGVFAPPPLLRS